MYYYNVIVTLLAIMFAFLYFVLRRAQRELNLYTVREITRQEVKHRLEKDALEEGVQDLIDSYENDHLGLKEQIGYFTRSNELLREDIIRRDDIIEHHATKCHSIVADTFELVLEELEKAHPKAGNTSVVVQDNPPT